MRRSVAAIIALLCLAGAAEAQEPSTRRVYLLCQMEDPSCGPLLQSAYDEAIKDPYWAGIKQMCPRQRAQGIAPKTGDRLDPLTMDEIFHWFMTTNSATGAVLAEPVRIGMLYSIRMLWPCR